MYRDISNQECARELCSDAQNGFSYDGALALMEYFDEINDSCGCRIMYDPVAFRCEYSEYGSALECVTDYEGLDGACGAASFFGMDNTDKDALEEAALTYLMDRTSVIRFDGGVVVQNF